VSGAAGHVVLAVSPDGPAEAVEVAFAQAARRGVPLLAVRVRHDPDLPLGGWLSPERLARWDAAHAAARHELDRAVEQARAAHPAVTLTSIVADDEPVPFLATLSVGAELLVLGRPHRPARHPSPVDELVRRAACPVLVVPPVRRPSPAPMRTPTPSGR
jgi:nucleotide-binding universal stress UspA family protein